MLNLTFLGPGHQTVPFPFTIKLPGNLQPGPISLLAEGSSDLSRQLQRVLSQTPTKRNDHLMKQAMTFLQHGSDRLLLGLSNIR